MGLAQRQTASLHVMVEHKAAGIPLNFSVTIKYLSADCRLQQEVSSREQLWSKNTDLDARLNKVTERNEHLVDELRAQEAVAATGRGQTPHTSCARAFSVILSSTGSSVIRFCCVLCCCECCQNLVEDITCIRLDA